MKKINDSTLDLLEKRYFQTIEGKKEKTWEDISDRVSRSIAMAEEKDKRQKWRNVFHSMISNMEFIPSTPCLINAREDKSGQLSSCFILSLKDNIESIYQTKSDCAKIFQKNGGAGFNISVLRPEGATVETSKGFSCGVTGFMEEFDLTADVVTRNNIRKGAIKIDLEVWHPEIFKYIHIKDDTSKLQRMNISVAVDDNFMNAVKNNQEWDLKFPDYSWNKKIYNEEWNGDINEWERKGYPVKIYQTIKAVDLYKEIMNCAWKTGEPGITMISSIEKSNPNKHLDRACGTNPCSEFSSIPYNSCNLGSINLLTCIDNNKFNYNKFETLASNAVRFLDNMISVNKLPIEKIEKITKSVRSVGLGVMGFADALYKLGIPYNSKEGLDFADELFSNMRKFAIDTSKILAKEKGVYEKWEGSEWSKNNIKIRNSNLLSIAPTGSISFIANVSGGIEPNFALVYTRRTNEGDIYYIVNEIFSDELKKRNLYSEELLQKIVDNNGSCIGVKEIPLDMQRIFVSASDINPTEHVDMATKIQEYVDLSISKTTNLSHEATVEDIMDVYMRAWEQGSKGITVYRDGCRENQTLSVKRDVKNDDSTSNSLARGEWKPLSDDIIYIPRKVYIGCGKIKLFIGWSEQEQSIQDFYVVRSGNGGCERNLQGMVISMSGMLRLGGNLTNIEKAYEGLGSCNSFVSKRTKGEKLSKGGSCGSAILNEIKLFLSEKNVKSNNIIIVKKDNKPKEDENYKKEKMDYITQFGEADYANKFGKCPLCDEPIKHVDGCISCTCGWSKCN